MILSRFCSFAVLLVAVPAWAEPAAGAACAKALPPDAAMIYRATAPEVGPETNLRDAITAHARALVMVGKIERSAGRPAAEAAGACLRKLQG